MWPMVSLESPTIINLTNCNFGPFVHWASLPLAVKKVFVEELIEKIVRAPGNKKEVLSR